MSPLKTVHVTVELEGAIRQQLLECSEQMDTDADGNEDYREGYSDALEWVLKEAHVKEEE